MTLKKSMISIAAAGVIAATITGCGSSGSSGAVANTAQPTSLTAIDGYVIGAKIEVGYDDGNTSTAVKTTAIDNSANYALTADENGLIKAGSYTYDIKEVNSTVLDNIRYIKLTPQNGGNAADGSVVYAPTFIDVSDTNFTYNVADGDQAVAAGFELIAPAGFKVITPISTLVYKSVVNSIDANESNASELIADALADIAAALGVSANDIKDLDPISAIQTKPEYALINAFLKDVVELTPAQAETIAESLKTQPAVTGTTTAAKISSAFTNLETAAAGTTAAALFTTAKAAFAGTDGNNYVEALKTGAYNVDKTREASKAGDFSLVTNSLVLSDINVTSIYVDGLDISKISSKGDKIEKSNVAFELELESNTDENVTKSATFVTKISLERAYEIADKNVTDLTISLPITIGAMTTGDVNVTSGANVSYAGRADDGSLISGELNASYIATGNDTTTFARVTNNTTLELNATALIQAVDTNLTKAKIDGDVIANLQVALVDTDSALARIESVTVGSTTTTANAYWSPLTVNSYNAASTFAGKKLLDLTAADMRNTATEQNVAPQNGIQLVATTGNATQTGKVIVINDDSIVTNNVSGSVTNTFEANTSATFTLGTLPANVTFDLNTTDLIKMIKGTTNAGTAAAGTGFAEVNTTSTATGELNTTLTTVFTDEFGESNTTAYTININRAPVAVGTKTSATKFKLATDYDANYKDVNVSVNDVNETGYKVLSDITWTDLNITGGAEAGFVRARLADNNTTLEFNTSFPTTGESNLTVDFNVTDTYGLGLFSKKVDLNSSKTGVINNLR